jgi:hypothetical protein
MPATIAAVSKPRPTVSRVKALPWAVLLQAGAVLGKRWRRLSEKDRARLRGLVRDSRGRPGNLSAKDRRELRRLLGKLDVKGGARELLAVLRGGRRRKRR